MAQVLVTIENSWYQNIGSIRNYSEGDFEKKILKYATSIFTSYFVLKCKYTIQKKGNRNERYKPDFILVSKDFKSWIIVEVELCGKPLAHTIRQIECFSSPEYIAEELAEYLVNHNEGIKEKKEDLLFLLENKDPDILVIYDDYCSDIFDKLKSQFSRLPICVIETYRTANHDLESYRISGDYPYQISSISPLKFYDHQHFEILRGTLFDEFNDSDDIDLYYLMKVYKAKIFKERNKVFIKIPENPFPPDATFQLEIDITKRLIIKKL